MQETNQLLDKMGQLKSDFMVITVSNDGEGISPELIIEDDYDIRSANRAALELEGYQVMDAEKPIDGRYARRKMKDGENE